MNRIYLLRTIGVLMMIFGPILMRRFDERDEDQRYLKMLCAFCIPIGFMIVMATIIRFGGM